MNGNFTGFEPPDDWVSTPKTRSATADDDAKAVEADLDRETEEEDEKNAPPDVAPRPAPSRDVVFELTGVAKASGILSKRITLNPDGSVKADGSACTMASGGACRLRFDAANLQAFADTIAALDPHEAITLGALRPDLPEQVKITTKHKLNGNAYRPNDLIARTAEWIAYRPGELALALLDLDVKDLPPEVRTRIAALGGYGAALSSVLPELANVGLVVRRSTSAGLYRTDTGRKLAGSDGRHVFVPVIDGTDIVRFLQTFHDRLWLHGLGWFTVSRAAQLLERSLIDRSVSSPERLVFEGAPVLEPPLAQDKASRTPTVTEGSPLDTRAACPDLTDVERAKLRALKDAERHRLRGEAEKVLTHVIEDFAKAADCTREAARHAVARRLAGILLPDVVLPFDDDELAGKTVADVLADPDRFVGETLADPLEGIEYGRCKAKIMPLRPDGSLWVHSFAHGRTIYDLKYNAPTIDTAVRAAPDKDKVALFVRLLLLADISPDEEQSLLYAVRDLTKTGIVPLKARIKAAREEQRQQKAQAERQRRAAERTDSRPQLPAPLPDDEWLPQMDILNEVMGASAKPEPPMRDIEGWMTEVRVRQVPNMHALTADGTNDEEPDEGRLPPPEQPLLSRLSEAALAESIERHIQYIDQDSGRPVHLGSSFVGHYQRRDDDALPIVAAIATLPIVLADGTLLATNGLHRDRGVVFRVPEQLLAILPTRAQCDADAVRRAYTYLADEWLVDVATDPIGKAILIADALTVIERVLLPDRPVFFLTAGRRGSGKTTVLIMLLTAITGTRPPAAAWSPNEEERRKALLAYLMSGVATIIWDNISRGSKITCPHIERSCTTAFYSDRVLGVSATATAAASAIHQFTGNNIGPRGDLASRALTTRLEVDRHDPENRVFVHPDPIGWTQAHRGKILNALYTLLLGNPALWPINVAPRTRFKTWWQLAGSPVEHAAGLCGIELDFQSLFLEQEEEDEDSASLADALVVLHAKWPNTFQAADIAYVINDRSDFTSEIDKERAATLRDFLFPDLDKRPDQTVSAKAVGKRLQKHLGEPVRAGTQTLCLKKEPKPGSGDAPLRYYVHAT